jgi:hypothetical protein
MYVYRPSSPTSQWAIDIAATNTSSGTNPNSITGITTTAPNTVTMAFWSSAATNTWGTLTGTGWSKTGLSNQIRNTTTGQSHTAAYSINATATTVANVAQTQSATTTALKTILAWCERPPANDDCNNAIILTSAPTCSTITGTLGGASYTGGGGVPGCSGSTNLDVWYAFVAQSTNPTITTTLTSGSGQRRTELYTGSCGSFSATSCSGNSNNLNATGLTIGQTYFVRVYSNNTSPYAFTICVTDPAPPNDNCNNAVVLTSGTSCSTTTGNMYPATLSSVSISGVNCAASPAVTYDVWYKFVAQTTNPTISLSNIGTSFTNAGMQILSNNCGSNFTSLFCGTTAIAADFLTPGTIYFIRVFSTGTVPTSPTNANFDICITDPVATPPANDECTGAFNMSIANGCNSIPGNMAGATASAQPLGGSCTGPLAYDVWYRFTAINSTATIQLSSYGTNFGANRGVEILSGTCGSLTSLSCGSTSGTGTLSVTATGLTSGNTYYVRVYSTATPSPNGDARFNICATSSAAPVVTYGNSYVNISKKTTGGVVQPGDTLEIRMAIQYSGSTAMTNLRFVDNVPTKTAMLTGASDRINIITNEGLTYKAYTLTAGDDAATYLASPPAGQYNIRMNVGFDTKYNGGAPGTIGPGVVVDNTSTTTTNTGSMIKTNVPSLFGSSIIFSTAYRVVVTGVVGDTVTLNPAQFIYNDGTSDVTLTATSYKILISDPLTLCSNSIGINIASEFGGTFGSGTATNRSTDLTTPIANYGFVSEVNAYNSVGDGRYALIKNISPRNRTNQNANFARGCGTLHYDDPLNCNNRMHNGHWYIDGDHTGTNNATGNAPPSATTNSGYMLEVNADLNASEVYKQTLTNLCPNTYYEFSAWVRNICPTCGSDSLAKQFAGTSTSPSGGYPGVYPNLSFSLDGLDYYNTGEIDTVGWLKKGFVFRTGATQTNAVFSIRNNAQGGGGNDWVLDDIAVATCLPTMSYSPTINPNVCSGNPITIADTISSFFKNYTTYKWQRSTNSGLSWTDITGVTSLPDTNNYITSYTVFPSNTTLSDSGDLYRVVVATTTANLTNANCNISDGVTITLSVLSCDPVLDIDLLYLNGKLINNYGNLYWATSREEGPYTYIIEKSTNQTNFIPIGRINGNNNSSLEKNYYSFADPDRIDGKVWYRLVMMDARGAKKYSRIISLKNTSTEFAVDGVTNPFKDKLYFEIITDQNTKIDVWLIDISGRPVIKKSFMAYTGTNSFNLNNTETLAPGIYALRIEGQGVIFSKKVVKKN